VFEVTLIAPNNREFSVALDRRMRLEDDDTTWGNFYHRLHEPNSGLNHIAIYLYPAAPSGLWRFKAGFGGEQRPLEAVEASTEPALIGALRWIAATRHRWRAASPSAGQSELPSPAAETPSD